MTGSVEFGAQVILEAFRHGKPVVLMNAEVDATIGPILRVYAKKHGVILSACDGDEPGVQMNLVRWVKGLGLIPRVMGNVKGLQDPYRNPTTQQGLGRAVGPERGDGDLLRRRLEDQLRADDRRQRHRLQGAVAGHVARPSSTTARSWTSHKLYDLDELRALGGIVDYTVGPAADQGLRASPSTPTPSSATTSNLYKMGEGPLYPFWIPYHLVHFETPERHRPGGALRRRAGAAARRAGGRGLRGGQARPQGRRGARRVRHVHDLRRGGERRRDERAAATCPRGWWRAAGSSATSPRTRC